MDPSWSWIMTAFVLGFSTSMLMNKYVRKVEIVDKKRNHIDGQLIGSDNEESDDDEEEEDPKLLGTEPLKMVLVVRTDLQMNKGKIAAQCCHACLGAYERADRELVRQWKRFGQAKVTVKCQGEEELLTIAAIAKSLGLPHYVVCDAGRTQIAAGSLTVCGVGPAPESLVNQVTGQLKLL